MSWTGSPSTHDENGRFAAAQVANAATNDLQNQRAARVVAGRAIDAGDCAEMLAMLGLDAGIDRIPSDRVSADRVPAARIADRVSTDRLVAG